MKSISEWQRDVYDLSTAKGWRPEEGRSLEEETERVPVYIALIHSEVSESLECWREGQMHTQFKEVHFGGQGKPEGFPSELADVVIRCLDLAQALGINLEQEMVRKHIFNHARPHRHGGKRA